jgi:hypothetical protein
MIGGTNTVPIVGMYKFDPTISDKLLHRPTRERQSAFVKKRTQPVRISHPDGDRRSVGETPKALFALAQRLLSEPALRELLL